MQKHTLSFCAILNIVMNDSMKGISKKVLSLMLLLYICMYAWPGTPSKRPVAKRPFKYIRARIHRPSVRENKPKTLVFSNRKRAFWAGFRENWVYKFGHRFQHVLRDKSFKTPSFLFLNTCVKDYANLEPKDFMELMNTFTR